MIGSNPVGTAIYKVKQPQIFVVLKLFFKIHFYIHNSSFISKKDNIHERHKNKQQTQEYIELAKERYKIEAKNAEFKNEHGYAHASYAGIHGMTLQADVSIFVVNLKRVLRLKNGKEVK